MKQTAPWVGLWWLCSLAIVFRSFEVPSGGFRCLRKLVADMLNKVGLKSMVKRISDVGSQLEYSQVSTVTGSSFTISCDLIKYIYIYYYNK